MKILVSQRPGVLLLMFQFTWKFKLCDLPWTKIRISWGSPVSKLKLRIIFSDEFTIEKEAYQPLPAGGSFILGQEHDGKPILSDGTSFNQKKSTRFGHFGGFVLDFPIFIYW